MSGSAFCDDVEGAARSPTNDWLEGFAATQTAEVDERAGLGGEA